MHAHRMAIRGPDEAATFDTTTAQRRGREIQAYDDETPKAPIDT